MSDLAAWRVAADAWISADPDPETAATLRQQLDAGDDAALRAAFEHPLTFGTAGLRGEEGPGPARMNRLVVRRTTWALATHLLATCSDAAERGVVIGCDARSGSSAFAEEAAAVAAGLGLVVHELPRAFPTPLCPFAVAQLGAVAGIQITASHNPAKDNGYKVYAADGAQIIAPDDAAVASLAARAPALVELAPAQSPLRRPVDGALVDAYRRTALGLLSPGSPRALRIVYTPLHGVGGALVPDLLRRAGFGPVHVVEEQLHPDPAFPTVAFPNPEEPGALDLALRLAEQVEADLVVANDPDADRLALCVRDAQGNYVQLSGDQVGWLLADATSRRLRRDGSRGMFATTIVSSSMLEALCAARHLDFAETLTGFKWIARAGLRSGQPLAFGYEEALGYAVSPLVADKDGMTAALVACELAAAAASQGTSLLATIDALESALGVHSTSSFSLRFDGPEGPEAMAALLADLLTEPPTELGGSAVLAFENLAQGYRGLPPTTGLRLELEGPTRVIIRPSGTEPKVKVYLEAVTEPPEHGELLAKRVEAAARLAETEMALRARLRPADER